MRSFNRKSIGIAFEREIIDFFWKNNGGAIRVAGSGAIRKPSCDIIAKLNDLFAIEAKKTKEDFIYLDKNQIQDLILFANKMGFEPIIVIKFKKDIKCINARNLDLNQECKTIRVSKDDCLNLEEYFLLR
ncbi:MAG: Holliday junction resolvase Hjc [Candidatus Woesearchaeota archaeon]